MRRWRPVCVSIRVWDVCRKWDQFKVRSLTAANHKKKQTNGILDV